jgi:multidrug efflux system outer membrane protein
MNRHLFGLIVAVVFGAEACAVGPHYHAPDLSVLSEWSNANLRGTNVDAVQNESWWEGFRDSELIRLINQAVAANQDLKVATARVEEARAVTGVVKSGLVPQVGVSGSAARIRQRTFTAGTENGEQSLRVVPIEINNFEGRFDASWELDVFGRVRSQLAAARADVIASEEDRRDVLVVVLSDVARWYADVRGQQLRISIARQNSLTAQEAVTLTEARRQAGLVTDLDVARARAQFESTEAAIPLLDAARAAAVHRLGVLVGSAPGTLEQELAQVAPIPLIPPQVPVGLPSDLLKRRPDVRRAEAQLIAATARIGVAKADYFPRFTLTGTAGRQATQLHDLTLGFSNVFGFGPSISLPIFTGGRIRSNVAVQEARVRQSSALYQSTVLRSLEETENALVNFAREQDRRDRLEAQMTQDQLVLELATAQYTAGLTDFLSVLDAERALYGSQDLLAQSQTAIVTHLVAVYKALGGRWTVLDNTK